jgi:threonine/homoserine/homoserine lactone efflux protein
MGFGLGLVVAGQPGPVTILLVRTAGRIGSFAGFMIGLAAACVDTTYAMLGALRAAPVLQWTRGRVTGALLGGTVLIVLGTRTLLSAWRPCGQETARENGSAGRTFVKGLAATASNPLTIASWAAIFAAASASAPVHSVTRAAALLIGIGIASLSWFTVLALASAVAVHRISARWVVLLDLVCGLGLVAFGVLLSARTVLAIL